MFVRVFDGPVAVCVLVSLGQVRPDTQGHQGAGQQQGGLHRFVFDACG